MWKSRPDNGGGKVDEEGAKALDQLKREQRSGAGGAGASQVPGGGGGGGDVVIKNELEWLRFREETLGPAAYQEPAGAKFMRKIKENPFVPLGAMLTLTALTYGLWCFRQGRGRDSQMMMRARIAAQGFTVVAILGGIVLGASTGPGEKAKASAEGGASG